MRLAMMKLPPAGLSLLLVAGLGVGAAVWPTSKTKTAPKQPAKVAAQAPEPAPQQTASIPLPAAQPQEAAPTPPSPPLPPAKMSLAEESGFDAWMTKTYLACWKPASPPADADTYVAQVRLAFKPDGSLMKPPKLVNPPSNPALKAQAKSAIAAVKACNPLPIPAQYRPFYDQWKTKTVHFNSQVAAR